MSINISLKIQENIKVLTTTLTAMDHEGADLIKLYWAKVSSDISALAEGDPATVNSKNTKAELVLGLSLLESYQKFLHNQAVTTTDQFSAIQSIKYGAAAAIAPVSEATEEFGDRLVYLCNDMLKTYHSANKVCETYNNTELGLAVSAVSDSTVIFGSDCTKDELIKAITLLQEFQKFINNAAVTQGDYMATISRWERL